jgi:hypothetical protein
VETAATAEEKAEAEKEKVVVARAVAGRAAAHGAGWARGALELGTKRAEVVEWTVVAWAGTATAAGTAAVTRIEAASGQSPEGTGTAWVGASIGEARAARVARAEAVALESTAKEAVAVGSATRMRAAKELAGTKGP